MSRPDAPSGPLDASRIDLLREPVAILLAGRDGDNLPTLTRASGLRVTPEGRVVVLLDAARCPALLDGLRDGGAVAMVVNRPSTHESIQLKGRDAAVGPAGPEDLECAAAYRAAWVGELAHLGYTEAFADAVVAAEPGDLVAVAFTPSAAFVQSPGPDAGRSL